MSADLLNALAAMTVAGSLAILAVFAARTSLRRRFGAQIAYAAWLTVPMVALAMLLPAPMRPVAALLQMTSVETLHTASITPMPTALDWRPALALLWLFGVFATAAAFVRQQRRYLHSLGRLHALDGNAITTVLRAEAIEGCPALIGAWRPRIVLPGDFEQRYAPRERELILAHEHMHLARGDARINALVAALRCLNWFNPLLHLAATRFRFDQELACDAAVIARFPEARRSYADAMLKTQLAGQTRQELRLPVGCRWSSQHPLKERISMLKHPLPTRARRAAGITLVALLGLAGAWAAWAAQPPRPATVETPPGTQVDAQVTISFDGKEAKSMRMIHPVGEPFGFKSDDADNNWEVEFVARPVAGNAIKVASTMRHDGKVISQPVIIAKSGTASIRVGGEPGQPADYALEITLALIDPAANPASTSHPEPPRSPQPPAPPAPPAAPPVP